MTACYEIYKLPRQRPSHTGGPQRRHRTLEELSGPTGPIFLGFLWLGGLLGPFLTMPSLPQPIDVVVVPPWENTSIPVWLHPRIRQKDVRNDRHTRSMKLCIQPISPPRTISTMSYPILPGCTTHLYYSFRTSTLIPDISMHVNHYLYSYVCTLILFIFVCSYVTR